MPAFYNIDNWRGWRVTVLPSDDKRRLIRVITGNDLLPFLWGTDIYYNLLFHRIDGKPKNIHVNYRWFLPHGNGAPTKQGIGVLDTEIERKLQNKYKAIHIGRLHTTQQYILSLSLSEGNDVWSENQEVAEFTLKDRDDFNINMIMVGISAFVGAIAGYIASLLTK